MGKGGYKSTTWEPGWNSGKTTSIRVPIVLKNDVLAYARAVDSKLINNVPSPSRDFLKITLNLIQRYIDYKRRNYHNNQHSRELDINTRAWDELRKFQKMIQESPELLS